MMEVSVRLQFTRECLGSVKRRVGRRTIFEMPRSPDLSVMFLPSWWKMSIRDAAKLMNRHQDLVKQIDWDPVIEGGELTMMRRVIRHANTQQREWFAEHEAFAAGAVITVHAALPSGVTIEEFNDLMVIVGNYRGVSPFFRREEQYGTFSVLSVLPRRRTREESQEATAKK